VRGGLGPDFFADGSWSYCQTGQDSGAFGWDGGFGTIWHVYRVRDLVVIVLTQRVFDGPRLPETRRAIREAAYSALTE
jgi:CubicO group peptidase (beta-lactamase class C family)